MEYTKQQLLSKRELDQLQKQLDALSGNILTDFSLDKEIFKREGYLLNIQKQRQQNKFFDVRAFADGRLYFFGLKEYFDINKINDVPGFFTDKLWALNKAYENNQFLEM